MLDAACAGEVFTSPTPDQMLEATQGRRRGRRRAAHREELHRRRAQLRDGGGARRSRGHRVAVRRRRTTTSRSRTRPGRPDDAASAPRCCSRRSSAPRPRRATTSTPWSRSRRRSTPPGARWASRSPAAPCPRPGKPTFDLPEDEMEVGVGIHGEPGRHRVPLASAKEIAEHARRPDRPRLRRRRDPRS